MFKYWNQTNKQNILTEIVFTKHISFYLFFLYHPSIDFTNFPMIVFFFLSTFITPSCRRCARCWYYWALHATFLKMRRFCRFKEHLKRSSLYLMILINWKKCLCFFHFVVLPLSQKIQLVKHLGEMFFLISVFLRHFACFCLF